MKEQPVSQLTRRCIEAELYGQLYETITEKLGKEAALEIIAENLRKTAFQAGQEFAALAQEKSLAHFATVVEIWKKGDAIEVADISIDGNTLSIEVVRCMYQESYRKMGLPEELCRMLSCSRDEPFAKGYSRKIRMERLTTLADGGNHCPFIFHWD
ncbi:L-2-amino-thiazoline-4-carboxylic acid hydrolase [Maridesulfovibrio hydrothermalis]|uniref:L-2-amino-thiazoline-4-carboxylic acid hydrolase n=1 Tax=Maridesulfovibrio hydrothermalis AM13 = DSM 14728 TaxID=1121451 RepID=L0RCX6_9BACT|nr:L-2-amino-thiazoline-4-carboxylic acid hydrolase [Maridesulfovibrio hydrothermalis]CCO24638.1 L-2-amino-thiazoline-4-carboxylic acid hydrolase [Maridesulfovibrio hydrothermalis AM13 = DSM 14728]